MKFISTMIPRFSISNEGLFAIMFLISQIPWSKSRTVFSFISLQCDIGNPFKCFQVSAFYTLNIMPASRNHELNGKFGFLCDHNLYPKNNRTQQFIIEPSPEEKKKCVTRLSKYLSSWLSFNSLQELNST